MAQIYLEIDASETYEKLMALSLRCNEKNVNLAMKRAFRRVPPRVKKILKEDIPKQYYATKGEIGDAVRPARITGGGLGGVGCIIPITAERKKLGRGGKGRFTSFGGRKGWNINGPYKITARIVKAGKSTLPSHAGSYGGQPPFRNLSAGSLNGLVFTRTGTSRLPIEVMSGIAIPQMPINRSEADVQHDIGQFVEERARHELEYLLRV